MWALIPASVRLGLTIGAAVAVLGGLTWAYEAIKDRGVQQERQRIEDANHEFERKADAGQATLDNCIRAGREWDRARGLCLQPGR